MNFFRFASLWISKLKMSDLHENDTSKLKMAISLFNHLLK